MFDFLQTETVGNSDVRFERKCTFHNIFVTVCVIFVQQKARGQVSGFAMFGPFKLRAPTCPKDVPERECKRIMREILEAVDHIHSRYDLRNSFGT